MFRLLQSVTGCAKQSTVQEVAGSLKISARMASMAIHPQFKYCICCLLHLLFAGSSTSSVDNMNKHHQHTHLEQKLNYRGT